VLVTYTLQCFYSLCDRPVLSLLGGPLKVLLDNLAPCAPAGLATRLSGEGLLFSCVKKVYGPFFIYLSGRLYFLFQNIAVSCNKIFHIPIFIRLTQQAWIKKWISTLHFKPGENNSFVDNTLRDLLAGCAAIVDIPASYYPGKLARAFRCKVICTAPSRQVMPSMLFLYSMMRRRREWLLFWPVQTLRYWFTFAEGS
jgi:hypothetical protein